MKYYYKFDIYKFFGNFCNGVMDGLIVGDWESGWMKFYEKVLGVIWNNKSKG